MIGQQPYSTLCQYHAAQWTHQISYNTSTRKENSHFIDTYKKRTNLIYQKRTTLTTSSDCPWPIIMYRISRSFQGIPLWATKVRPYQDHCYHAILFFIICSYLICRCSHVGTRLTYAKSLFRSGRSWEGCEELMLTVDLNLRSFYQSTTEPSHYSASPLSHYPAMTLSSYHTIQLSHNSAIPWSSYHVILLLCYPALPLSQLAQAY